MILVLGLWTFLRALLGRSTAVTLRERRPASSTGDPAAVSPSSSAPPPGPHLLGLPLTALGELAGQPGPRPPRNGRRTASPRVPALPALEVPTMPTRSPLDSAIRSAESSSTSALLTRPPPQGQPYRSSTRSRTRPAPLTCSAIAMPSTALTSSAGSSAWAFAKSSSPLERPGRISSPSASSARFAANASISSSCSTNAICVACFTRTSCTTTSRDLTRVSVTTAHAGVRSLQSRNETLRPSGSPFWPGQANHPGRMWSRGASEASAPASLEKALGNPATRPRVYECQPPLPGQDQIRIFVRCSASHTRDGPPLLWDRC
jgi:hypothetical protein